MFVSSNINLFIWNSNTERKTDKDIEREERASPHWFTFQMTKTTSADWVRSKSGAWNFQFSHMYKHSSTWAILHCFLRHISRTLDQKWSIQVSDLDFYEMPVSWMTALLAMLHNTSPINALLKRTHNHYGRK